MKLVNRGSVKDFYMEKEPTEDTFGVGVFEFTNDYSVFDWGKMPQTIPDKGEALKRESAHWFGRLEENGIRTHFIEDAGWSKMRVHASRKLGYGDIKTDTSNYMLPLEIIFRNEISPVGSLYRRLRDGSANPRRYGLPENFKPEDGRMITLSEPIVEFSTKIEEHDRYIDDDEAIRISGISDDEIAEIKSIALKVNQIVTDDVRKRGLDHVDGKIEVMLSPDREPYVADTVGTSDEDRFLYDGMDFSKQMIRDHYIRMGWYDTLTRERSEKVPRDRQTNPPPMDEGYYALVNNTYKAMCVAITGKKWNSGEEPPSLEEIASEYKRIIGKV